MLTGVRLLAAAFLPVTPDEAYYWTWSRTMQASYLDHPPMVALWIAAGTALFGDTGFGLRVLGPLAAMAGSVLLFLAARDLVAASSRDAATPAAVRAGILMNATLALGVGSVTMTPDTPLLFFVTLFLWALGRLRQSTQSGQGEQGGWWLMVGAAAGLGFDSKYTMVLPVLGLGVWAVLTREGRRQMGTPWPWFGAILGAVIATPVIWWNATHEWASFVRQGGRAGDWHPARAAQFLGELLGGQIGLATPGVFVLFVLGTWRACRGGRHERDDAGRLLPCLALIPALVFVQHALGDRVQANWPVLLYPMLAIMAAQSAPRWWRGAARFGIALGLLVLVQAGTAFLPLGRHLDVTLRQGGGWPAFSAAVAARSQGAAVIAADEYGLASELAFHLPDRRIAGTEARWRYFARPVIACDQGVGYVVHNARRSLPKDEAWSASAVAVAEIDREITRWGRDWVAERYTLYRIACPASGFAALPSPR